MILRNQQLNGSARRELHGKLFDASADRKAHSSLTLSNVSTSYDNDDDDDDGECSQPSSPSTTRTGGLHCDFLLGSAGEGQHSRIESLTIERCRLDLEGASVLGKALRSASSAVSTLRSLTLGNLDCDNGASDNDEILVRILEGIASANGCCLETLEVRQMPLPNSPILRRRFFSALGSCANLTSLRLVNCDLRTEDAPDLAAAIEARSDTLVSLDLSRNDIDGSGVNTLLQDGLHHHGSLRRLILSHNPIGDDGAVHLSRFLSRASKSNATIATATTRIASLGLVDCDIWSAGCRSLSRSLKDFDTLGELVVGGEWEPHLGAVVESLRTNVVLKRLWVVSDDPYQSRDDDRGCCGFELEVDRHRDRIEYYLALNRAHRRISIEPGLSFKLWPSVLATSAARLEGGGGVAVGCSTADMWYHLLQRRPDLVATSTVA